MVVWNTTTSPSIDEKIQLKNNKRNQKYRISNYKKKTTTQKETRNKK
jgi:hypothetical protein